MTNFKELFEAKVNFGEKGDVLVVKYGKPTSIYIFKKKDIKKEFRDEKKYGDMTDEDGLYIDVSALSQGETMDSDIYDGYAFVGL